MPNSVGREGVKNLWFIFQQPQSSGFSDRLHLVVNTQFVVNIAGMRLDRVQGEYQLGCDFRAGETGGDKVENFPFSVT